MVRVGNVKGWFFSITNILPPTHRRCQIGRASTTSSLKSVLKWMNKNLKFVYYLRHVLKAIVLFVCILCELNGLGNTLVETTELATAGSE